MADYEKAPATYLHPDVDKTPQTYLDEPSDIDIKNLTPEEKKDVVAYASSSYSADTDLTVVEPSGFTRSKTLLINARGIALLRFPLPSKELEIQISTPEGEIAYVSTREKRSSGNAILSDANRKALISSEYLFGPGRDPKLRLLNQDLEAEVKVKGKWTSRRQEFVLPNGPTVIWRYVREVDPSASNTKGKKRAFLVLEVSDTKKGENVRLAQLLRNDESRTPGTKSCDAGNGGEIVLDENALLSLGVREDVVIATCLMMLKKEIDRRRAHQIMVMAAASSGGS
jgi:hypothetical protein